MQKRITAINNGGMLEKIASSRPSTGLQIGGWYLLLDLALFVTATLMIVTSTTVVYFHIVFILLTLGAFFWRFYAFAVRAIVWVAVTSVVVALAIIAGETQAEEITEIPLLTAILIIVFVVAHQRSKAQDSLRQSEARYSTLFDNLFGESLDAIFITDNESKIIDANQSMLDLMGCTSEELIGLDYPTAYVRADSRNEFQRELEGNGFVKDYELDLVKTDGTQIYGLLNSSTWRINDGTV
ncbi:MAG: PAS domain-containing protein, partial [Anaerolineae bacterium]|nr:PAS domain-containing protein [Anaerolineae bacterium]